MKKKFSTILLILVFVVGISLLLYPAVSNAVNERHQTRAVDGYEQSIKNLSQQDYASMLADAAEYNQSLLSNGNRYQLSKEQEALYESLLNPGGNGMMGYIEISSINVRIPIYHGIDDAVLQVGVGHIPGSSLPVGGVGTHAVLSGHRGLPSSKLFTDLDKVSEGDIFLIHVLDETLAYVVDQILIVKPEETESLNIDPKKDYCTLVTCTPYGINSHRILVRGVRTDYVPDDGSYIQADAVLVDDFIVYSILGVPMLLIILIVILLISGKRRKEEL